VTFREKSRSGEKVKEPLLYAQGAKLPRRKNKGSEVQKKDGTRPRGPNREKKKKKKKPPTYGTPLNGKRVGRPGKIGWGKMVIKPNESLRSPELSVLSDPLRTNINTCPKGVAASAAQKARGGGKGYSSFACKPSKKLDDVQKKKDVPLKGGGGLRGAVGQKKKKKIKKEPQNQGGQRPRGRQPAKSGMGRTLRKNQAK